MHFFVFEIFFRFKELHVVTPSYLHLIFEYLYAKLVVLLYIKDTVIIIIKEVVVLCAEDLEGVPGVQTPLPL